MEQDALAKAHPVFIMRAKPRQQLETFLGSVAKRCGHSPYTIPNILAFDFSVLFVSYSLFVGAHRCVRPAIVWCFHWTDTSVCPYGKGNVIRTIVGASPVCAPNHCAVLSSGRHIGLPLREMTIRHKNRKTNNVGAHRRCAPKTHIGKETTTRTTVPLLLWFLQENYEKIGL